MTINVELLQVGDILTHSTANYIIDKIIISYGGVWSVDVINKRNGNLLHGIKVETFDSHIPQKISNWKTLIEQ